MAEYVDGSEKAPLQTTATAAAVKRGAPQKPDWSRFGLSGGGADGQQTASARSGTSGDDDAREVNEIYAEHEVCTVYNIIIIIIISLR